MVREARLYSHGVLEYVPVCIYAHVYPDTDLILACPKPKNPK